MVFDSEEDFGISEFSYGEDAISPYESTLKQNPLSSYSIDSDKLYKIDQLTYCLIDETTGDGFDNYGEAVSALSEGLNFISSRSSSPDSWEQVLMDPSVVYRDYKIAAVNSVSGYSSYTEQYVKLVTGRYACTVSAMLTVCSFYTTTSGANGLDLDYTELWRRSRTEVDHTQNGIIYGSTQAGSIPEAIRGFCLDRGTSVNVSQVAFANWTAYKNNIDSGNMSIFSGTLKVNANSGHAMAVAGYISLTNKVDVLDFMNTLMVCDGWNGGLRILNHNLLHYSSNMGTFVS